MFADIFAFILTWMQSAIRLFTCVCKHPNQYRSPIIYSYYIPSRTMWQHSRDQSQQHVIHSCIAVERKFLVYVHVWCTFSWTMNPLSGSSAVDANTISLLRPVKTGKYFCLFNLWTSNQPFFEILMGINHWLIMYCIYFIIILIRCIWLHIIMRRKINNKKKTDKRFFYNVAVCTTLDAVTTSLPILRNCGIEV